MAEVAFSRTNIIKGAMATGDITDASGSGPNYKRMLMNCPTINMHVGIDQGKVDSLLAGCMVIAKEMLIERDSNLKTFLGTPCDRRMVREFGGVFGEIFIGPGETSSGDRVTALKMIRWPSTLLDADGQLQIEKDKRSTLAVKIANALACVPGPIVLSSNLVIEVFGNDVAAPMVSETQPTARNGKKSGNISCPDHAHYYAALCKTTCTKCPKVA